MLTRDKLARAKLWGAMAPLGFLNFSLIVRSNYKKSRRGFRSIANAPLVFQFRVISTFVIKNILLINLNKNQFECKLNVYREINFIKIYPKSDYYFYIIKVDWMLTFASI